MSRGGDATIGDWIPGLLTLGAGIWCLRETHLVRIFDVVGWRWFGCQGNMAAIIVPEDIAHHAKWSSSFDGRADFSRGRVSSLLLDNVGICSAYFPHDGKSLEEFSLVAWEVDHHLKVLKEKGAKHFVLGCDLNNPLPCNYNGVTGGGIYRPPTLSDFARIDIFMPILANYNLQASNTFDDGSQAFTRVSWGERKFRTQIDFIFASETLKVHQPFVSVNNKFCGDEFRLSNSDHFPVHGYFDLGERTLNLQKPRKTMNGYKVLDSQGSEAFGKKLMMNMNFDGTPQQLRNDGNTFTHFENSILDAANSVPFTTRRQRADDVQKKPIELVMMKKERLLTLPGSLERAEARKKENRLKRKWKARTALSQGSKSKVSKPLMQLQVGETLTSDKQKWKAEVMDYCTNKYTEAELVDTNIDDVFQRAVNARNQSRSFGSVDPPMKLSDVFAGRANLQHGKSGGGGSLVVNEMLKFMPYLMVFLGMENDGWKI